MIRTLLDGPVRTRAFWVFVIAELVAIAASLGVAPELIGQAESVALHVINIVFYSAAMSGTAGTIPVAKLERGVDGVYRERRAGEAGHGGNVTLLVIAVCIVIALLFDWGLLNRLID